ncbi:5978_t:CDS:2, partial [Ambispora leptoticha]
PQICRLYDPQIVYPEHNNYSHVINVDEYQETGIWPGYDYICEDDSENFSDSDYSDESYISSISSDQASIPCKNFEEEPNGLEPSGNVDGPGPLPTIPLKNNTAAFVGKFEESGKLVVVFEEEVVEVDEPEVVVEVGLEDVVVVVEDD